MHVYTAVHKGDNDRIWVEIMLGSHKNFCKIIGSVLDFFGLNGNNKAVRNVSEIS